MVTENDDGRPPVATPPPTPTLEQMIRSVGRELGMRRAAYPGWIKAKRHFAGKLFTQEIADHEIACMEAVYRLLKSLAEGGPDA